MTKQDHAAILLRRLLADGPVSVVGIKERAIEAGISFKTFIIAKKEIGIASEERADGWWWSLPRE
jgi:hypothetical protein